MFMYMLTVLGELGLCVKMQKKGDGVGRYHTYHSPARVREMRESPPSPPQWAHTHPAPTARVPPTVEVSEHDNNTPNTTHVGDAAHTTVTCVERMKCTSLRAHGTLCDGVWACVHIPRAQNECGSSQSAVARRASCAVHGTRRQAEPLVGPCTRWVRWLCHSYANRPSPGQGELSGRERVPEHADEGDDDPGPIESRDAVAQQR